jgi:uncharacterized protein YndB with AHSA1/START domain
MPRVSHHFVVDRPIDAVFDVVTTARFWTEWHPATRGVEGDVDHPARLGDRIIEHVTIAGIEGSGTWTVVEYDRPHQLALETDLAVGHLRIAYQLTTVDGGTRFQRDLDFPELGPQVNAAMEAQSAEGITSLGQLVRRMVPPPGAATIDELIARMEDMQARLDASGDGRRHWHGVYRRGTIAVRDEIRRGGFLDGAWLERWDLVFADIYLEAMDRWDRGLSPSGPWQVAFEATRDPAIPPLRHVLLGLNAHVNFDLPQALIGVISDEEFDDPQVLRRRFTDHKHVDDVLVVRVASEDREIAAAERPGDRSLADRLLVPLNRAGSRKFLKEARAKVYDNARLLSAARQQGPEELASRLAQLEELCRSRVADLRAPGQVLLKLTLRGFGVALPGKLPMGISEPAKAPGRGAVAAVRRRG